MPKRIRRGLVFATELVVALVLFTLADTVLHGRTARLVTSGGIGSLVGAFVGMIAPAIEKYRSPRD